MDYLPHIERVGNHGPDFLCKIGNGSIAYFEAICPSQGINDNKVNDIDIGSVGYVPGNKVVLRLTSAFIDKHRKYIDYLINGLVDETAPFVIAINGCAVPHTQIDSDPPFIVQSLFPIGSPYISVDPIDGKIVGQGYSYQREIKKEHNNAVVRKDMFLDVTYSGISAVIYSQLHPYFLFDPTMQYLKIVHNPNAKNPLPRGFLPTGFEYWYENSHIKREKVGIT